MDVSGTIRAILNQKSDEVFSISSDATVFEAIEMMDAKNVGALLVMKQERLVGIISERDYTRKVVLRGKRSREAKVAEIMSTNVFTTRPSEGVDECLHHARQAYSSASARWRQGYRCDFHWRSGQTTFSASKRDRSWKAITADLG
jgi:predicted transcriptional regulator